MAELDFSNGGVAVEDLPDFSKGGVYADQEQKGMEVDGSKPPRLAPQMEPRSTPQLLGPADLRQGQTEEETLREPPRFGPGWSESVAQDRMPPFAVGENTEPWTGASAARITPPMFPGLESPQIPGSPMEQSAQNYAARQRFSGKDVPPPEGQSHTSAEPTIPIGTMLFGAGDDLLQGLTPEQRKDPYNKLVAGLGESLRSNLDSFTSIDNLSLMGLGGAAAKLGPLGARAAAAAFLWLVGKHIPETSRELGAEFGKPPEERDQKKIGNLIGNAAVELGIAGTTAFHAVRPGPITDLSPKNQFDQAIEPAPEPAPSPQPTPTVEPSPVVPKGINPKLVKQTKELTDFLKSKGVEVDEFLKNPYDHVTSVDVQKDGSMQVRIENHTEGTLSTKMVNVEPGQSLSNPSTFKFVEGKGTLVVRPDGTTYDPTVEPAPAAAPKAVEQAPTVPPAPEVSPATSVETPTPPPEPPAVAKAGEGGATEFKSKVIGAVQKLGVRNKIDPQPDYSWLKGFSHATYFTIEGKDYVGFWKPAKSNTGSRAMFNHPEQLWVYPKSALEKTTIQRPLLSIDLPEIIKTPIYESPTSKTVENVPSGDATPPARQVEPVPVWKVGYTDLEDRAARRPFFKKTVDVEAPTRKEAIEKVQNYHGNASKYGEFRASKAKPGTQAMSMFRHIAEEPPPTEPPQPAPTSSPPNPPRPPHLQKWKNAIPVHPLEACPLDSE